jgi:hypothetical protein
VLLLLSTAFDAMLLLPRVEDTALEALEVEAP